MCRAALNDFKGAGYKFLAHSRIAVPLDPGHFSGDDIHFEWPEEPNRASAAFSFCTIRLGPLSGFEAASSILIGPPWPGQNVIPPSIPESPREGTWPNEMQGESSTTSAITVCANAMP